MKSPYFTENIQVSVTLSELGKVLEIIDDDLENIMNNPSDEVPEGLRRLYVKEVMEIRKKLNDQYQAAAQAQVWGASK